MRHSLIRVFMRSAAILLMSPAAWAQLPAPPPPDAHGPTMVYEEATPGVPVAEGPVGFVSFEMGLGGSVMKGAPYSAQTSVETTQVLADGNRINRKTTGSIYRDSAGRTRREETLPAIGPFAASRNAPHVIFLNDPVAGVHYALEPDQKIARKMTPPPSKADFIKEFKKELPSGDHFYAPAHGEVTTESLGTQAIEGVAVEGTRSTRTIPVGEIGNEKPIVVVVEKWYSPDLQTTVMVTRSDPRIGTMVYKLTSINRAEPASTLFEVPADYTVKEGGPMGLRIERHLQH
jgi:hypothetical protein